MKKLVSLAVVLAVLVLTATVVIPAKIFHDNYNYPVTWTVFVPCANDGLGETIVLTGRMHVNDFLSISNDGSWNLKMHIQPMDLQGLGQTTGDKYNGTGVTQSKENMSGKGLPYSWTYVNNYRMIGQGPGNNFTVHETIHFTINANGELTADVVNVKTDCK